MLSYFHYSKCTLVHFMSSWGEALPLAVPLPVTIIALSHSNSNRVALRLTS